MNFKIGSYYKHIWFNGKRTWYFKLTKIKKDKLYTSDYYIQNCEYIPTDGTSSIVSIDEEDFNLEEVEFEIIVDYIPDTNNDKITYLRKRKIKFLLNV